MKGRAGLAVGTLIATVGLLAGAGLSSSAAPVVNSVDHQADVQLANYWLMFRASQQSDPTGRNYRFFMQEIMREVVVEAMHCEAETGDADCDPEG